MVAVSHTCQEVHFQNCGVLLELELCVQLDVLCSSSHTTAVRHHALSPSEFMSPLKVLTCICLLSQYVGDALLQWMHNFSSDLQQSPRSHKVLSSTKQRRYGLLSPFWIAVCRYRLSDSAENKEGKKKIHTLGPATSTASGLIQPKWKSTTGVHDEEESLGYIGPSALTGVRIRESEWR